MRKKTVSKIPLAAAFVLAFVLCQLSSVSAFGEPDLSFGINGAINDITGYLPNAIARQSDGKILVAGFKLDENGQIVFILRRFNSNGALDTSFGNNGTAIPYNVYGSAINLYVQSDGKIVVSGITSSPGTYGAVWRFNSNGWYDSTFGYYGRALLGDTTCEAAPNYPSSGRAPEVIVSCRSKLYRLYSSGTLNTSFGSNGSVTVPISIAGKRSLLVKQGTSFSEPRIYIAGSYAGNPAIARYLIDGQLDTSFGFGGVFSQNPVQVSGCDDIFSGNTPLYTSLAFQTGGKIVARGRLSNTSTQFHKTFLNRHLSNGDFDAAFTGGFSNSCNADDSFIDLETIRILPDNKILRASQSSVFRDTAEGEPDGSFSTLTNGNRDFIVQPDGKIVVISSAGNQLSRYLP